MYFERRFLLSFLFHLLEVGVQLTLTISLKLNLLIDDGDHKAWHTDFLRLFFPPETATIAQNT